MFAVSIVQTYILQLKLFKSTAEIIIVEFQLYKLTSFNWNLYLSLIVERYHGFNCTNLHPSTETCEGRIVHAKVSVFQLYKLTSFNWNRKDRDPGKKDSKVSIVQTYILQLKRGFRRVGFVADSCFNCTNLHPSTETIERHPVNSVVTVSIVQTYILQLKRLNGTQ